MCFWLQGLDQVFCLWRNSFLLNCKSTASLIYYLKGRLYYENGPISEHKQAAIVACAGKDLLEFLSGRLWPWASHSVFRISVENKNYWVFFLSTGILKALSGGLGYKVFNRKRLWSLLVQKMLDQGQWNRPSWACAWTLNNFFSS